MVYGDLKLRYLIFSFVLGNAQNETARSDIVFFLAKRWVYRLSTLRYLFPTTLSVMSPVIVSTLWILIQRKESSRKDLLQRHRYQRGPFTAKTMLSLMQKTTLPKFGLFDHQTLKKFNLV